MLRALLEYGASWLHFVALILGMGAVVGHGVLARAAAAADADGLSVRVRRSADRALQGAALLVAPAFAAILARQLVAFRDPFVPLGEDLGLLLGTDWGTAWWWGAGGALAASVLVLVGGRWRAGRWSGALALVLTGIYPAFTGHAAATDPRAVSIAFDVAHVWAASAWVGGLGLLVISLRHGQVGRARSGPAATALVGAFSPVAAGAVAVLASTGVWAGLQHLDAPGDLLTDAWGRILGVKLLVVAGALALGLRNWRWLTPRLGSARGDAAMRRSATAELVLGHLALVVTAVLIRTGPG